MMAEGEKGDGEEVEEVEEEFDKLFFSAATACGKGMIPEEGTDDDAAGVDVEVEEGIVYDTAV